MENVQQKKGMSKGCMIGLIIGVILVVLVIIAGTVCWIYKDDLAKMSATTMVNQMKTMVVDGTSEGVDTVAFNAICDAFNNKLEAEETLDMAKFQLFIQSLPQLIQDEEMSADDIDAAYGILIDYYPELEAHRPTVEEPEVLEEIEAVENVTGGE